jgi:hypothetical protein
MEQESVTAQEWSRAKIHETSYHGLSIVLLRRLVTKKRLGI